MFVNDDMLFSYLLNDIIFKLNNFILIFIIYLVQIYYILQSFSFYVYKFNIFFSFEYDKF